MTSELHINVGIVALARGYISLARFAAVVSSLAEGEPGPVRELWLGPGGLTEAQLASVLALIGPSSQARAESDAARRRGRVTVEERIGNRARRPTERPMPDHVPVVLLEVPVGSSVEPTAPTHVVSVSVPANAPTDVATAVPERDDDDDGADATRPGLLRPPSQPLPLAELLGGRYERLSLLGSGGLGEVMSCQDRVLGRTVAVKAGHQRGDIDRHSSNMILAREARIISCLEHPNIIPIYDAGTDRTRGPFYVMRQVGHTSLEVLLRRRRRRDGDTRDYALGRLLRYFSQVCNAVDYAHHRGIIHCDIKPANILVGDYGEVLLVDWGLAQSSSHPLRIRGGTFGYMAPEQMDPTVERVDERADVFALGAILYEILCGAPAFPDVNATGLTEPGDSSLGYYQRPPPPTTLATADEVPPEAEDICLRAIAIDREQRLASARLLADAIDELIEGTKRRERRLIEADRSADAGDELAERYHEFVEARPEKLAVVRALRADVEHWAALTDKFNLWDAEDVVRITDALQVRTFHSAVSAYERALDAAPGHARARRGLARMYWSELQRARHRGQALEEVAYEQLLRDVDDGTYVRELQRDGALELTIGARAGEVTLAELVERDRRLVEGPVQLISERPIARRALAAGSYVVKATIGGSDQTVAWSIGIESGARAQLVIDLPASLGPLAAGEVLIPGGVARLGGDPFSSEADEPALTDVPTFIIQRYPVTFAQWFAFLDELRGHDPALVEPHVPCLFRHVPAWRWTGDRWVAEATLPVVPDVDPLWLPVFGVSAESAEAYARWLSARDGRAWRLPTELEWEKAGRGTVGLIYPWGEHFDATFCKMRDSRSGPPMAEPIGAFAGDVSPYGVCDLAGGIADWCIPDRRRTSPRGLREVVSRGGAWCDWPIDCRLASRRRYLATEPTARVGVRLARDP